MARILSTAVATPEHRFEQSDAKKICEVFYPGTLHQNRHEEILDRSGVKTRYLVEPLEFYLAGPAFKTRNDHYLKHALHLSIRCIQDCLGSSTIGWESIRHILSVTTTGLLTPSLEARLVHTLPFSKNVKRTPIFGVGCAGGVVGLSRAEDYLQGHPEESVLLLSVELCSMTFLPGDDSIIQLVAAALFGDGAAAVLLAGDEVDHGADHPVEILGSESLLLPDSLHIMGWDFTDAGMKLILSREAPAIVERYLKGAVDSFLEKHRMTARDISYFLLHPGSLKIIEAFERALNLTPHDTRFTRRFLENYGNLSSASVLFILHDMLKTERPRPGSCGLLATMGPGFACEMLLLRFL